MTNKLLPCPFCGGAAHQDQIEQDDRAHFVIACLDAKCGAMANVSAWSRREPPPPQDHERLYDASTWREIVKSAHAAAEEISPAPAPRVGVEP